MIDPAPPPLVEDLGSVGRLVQRARRHVRWGRTQGFQRLVEEDRLDPLERLGSSLKRRRWRRHHGVVPGTATPVYVVGLQRSGTNMLMRGFEAAPEFETRNENDGRLFHRFQLRSDARTVAELDRSRHEYIVLKPLCDSHRVDELLELTPPTRAARAVWLYRSVDGRIRSAVAKFGDANRTVLMSIATGQGHERWQAQGLSEESLALVRSSDPATMSPESAAALFWYIRNRILLERGLSERADLQVVSYERLVAEPARVLRAVCAHLGAEYRPELIAHVDSRSVVAPRLDIDPDVRARCDDLTSRLDTIADMHLDQARTT